MEFVLILGGALLLFYVPYMVMASRRKAIVAALPLGRQLVGLDGLAGISCVDAAQAVVVKRHGDAKNLILTWDKISSCDIIEESGGQQTETVASARRSGVLGRAVVGKLLGGNAGEVIGGLTSGTKTRSRSVTEEKVSRILCQICFADMGLPEVSIRLYTDPYGRKITKSSRQYQAAMDTARSWHALMEVVIAQDTKPAPPARDTAVPMDNPIFPGADGSRNPASGRCKQCGNEVARNGATCPRCGARLRTSLRVKVIAGLAVILVGRCAVVSVRDSWDRDRAAARAAAAAKQAAEQANLARQAPVQPVQPTPALAQNGVPPTATDLADRQETPQEVKARRSEERKRLKARRFIAVSPEALAWKLKSAWPDWEEVFETKYQGNYVRWRGKYEREGMMLVEFIANSGRLSAFSCESFDPAQEGGSFSAAKWEDIIVEGRLDKAHDQMDKAAKTEFVLTECIARMAHQ
jgi:hypothetical protein